MKRINRGKSKKRVKTIKANRPDWRKDKRTGEWIDLKKGDENDRENRKKS